MKKVTKLPNPHTLKPDFMSRAKESEKRTHKLLIRLNENEMNALKRYQELCKGKSRAALSREAIMEKVIAALDENYPTLF